MDLRLIVITDAELARPRSVLDVVAACLEAGAPAVQLRDKTAGAADLLGQALALRDLTTRHDALLFVNDRLDVALAAGADGAHLGPDDIPLRAARRVVPPGFLLGFSTDDPTTARRAADDGADYIGCGAVFGTTSKADAAAERIGPEGLRRVAAATTLPVVGIGGIDPGNVASLRGTGASGVAVLSALMRAQDPGYATRRLIEAFTAPAAAERSSP